MNESNIRTFSVGTVLTVTTERLLTQPKGIGDLYELLNHMTRDNLFTHQLPRAARECKPWLLRWYPELSTPELQFAVGELVEMLKTPSGKESPQFLIVGWLSGIVAKGLVRESYDIGQIPQDDHDVIPPYDELVAMRGTDEGVVIIDQDGIHGDFEANP